MRLVDRFWFNAVWFQATWFCCVLGREPWVPVGLLSLAVHFFLVADRMGEFRRLLPVAMTGFGVDVVLTLAGVFDFETATIVPAWLMVLWWVFAAAIYRSFAKIGQSLWLAAVIGWDRGAVQLPGWRGLGAVSLPLGSAQTAVVLVAVWAFLLPLLYRISHRMAPAQ